MKRNIIQSIRLGFANNSSSTHSILLNAKSPPSPLIDTHYGWDDFHLTAPSDKARYMAALLKCQSFDLSEPQLQEVCEELTKTYSVDINELEDYAIDHQSVLKFPTNPDNSPNIQFIRELFTYVIETKSVSILGGNDNSDGPDVEYDSNLSSLLNSFSSPNSVIRNDKDHFIVFNTRTGAKIRFSFKDGVAPYESSTYPELIDVKITDYCPHGCKFCYMSSTKQGKHADLDSIFTFIDHCADKKVFEIAFGGGEPTLHPEFDKILSYTRKKGIQPNFTTFNTDFLSDSKNIDLINDVKPSFAISDLKEEHINRIKSLLKTDLEISNNHIAFQVPLGCYDISKISHFLRKVSAAELNFTLLGFKSFGRGVKIKPSDYSPIMDLLEELINKHSSYHRPFRFGADTLFVNQFKTDLIRRGISPTLMVSKEGAYSCYVDMVTKKMSASSYTTDSHALDLKEPFKNFPYV